MPNLPKPRIGRRGSRSRGVTAPPEPQEARAEIVEAPGLRWIHIERPRAIDQAWLEERLGKPLPGALLRAGNFPG